MTCLNKGVCQPLLGDHKCECLESSSGDHCEKMANHILIRQTISKSFSFIAILAMLSVIEFILVMDILKYYFAIDLTHDELERIRRQKRGEKVKHPVIKRYIYINTPSSDPMSVVQSSTG